MTSCAKGNDVQIVNNDDVGTLADVSEEQSEITDTSAAMDLDPEALLHKNDNLPYFYSYKAEEVTFEPSEDSVKFLGRHIEYKDVTYLSYTCSAVSFMMTGDRAEAVMVSNGGAYSSRQQGWVGVMINGELTERIQLEDGEKSYVLYDGEMLENAEMTIIKLSENQMASTGIKSITCNAKKIAPAAAKNMTIEFIGDSITCGYGNEALSPSDGMNTAQQNGTATYGYYTAQALDADWSMVCISGLGAVSNYTENVGEKEDYLLLEDVYEYTDSNFQMRRGYDDESWERWDFDEGSDIVVINIGTNDYTYTGEDDDLITEFSDCYADLLEVVRENNPHAYIVCTSGISGAELFEAIEAAAAEFSEKNNDERVLTMKFDYQNEEDGYGGDYHPSVKTHKKAADKLIEFIELNCQ